MGMYARNKKYISKTGEGKFYDILPKKLTFNKILWKPHQFTHETYFKEIKVKPYKELEEIKDFLKSIKQPQNKIDWIDVIFDSICDAIERRWIPEKYHIIGHSSGWDSRIISAALKILKKKNGDKWFGEVLFVENGGESKEFEKIMKRMGWKNYLTFNKNAPPGKYHKCSFINPHLKANGIISYPVNQWFDPFMILNVPTPNKVQFITGYGANEITEALKNKSISWYFKWHYYHQLNMFNVYGEEINPFWDFDFLKVISEIKNWQSLKIRLSEIIARKTSKELNDIPKLKTKDVRERGYRTVNNNLLKKIGADNPDIDYNYSWGKWFGEKVCEYLTSKEHEIYRNRGD